MFGFKPIQLPISPTISSQPSSKDRALVWLIAYLACNLSLTMYNKIVLAGDFPFPYTLTAIHCFFGTVGSLVCWKRGVFTPVRLTQTETAIVVLFSGLYTINIMVSNVSLFVYARIWLIVDISSPYHFIKSSAQRRPYSSSSSPLHYSRDHSPHKHITP